MNFRNYLLPTLFLSGFFLIIGSSSRPVDVLEDALVGHWTFDDKENMAKDNSRFKSHGALIGDPKKASGIIGEGCLELDGDGDFMEVIENGKAPTQLHNLGQGSISIWFKARNIPVQTSISPLFHYGNSLGCEKRKDASNEGLSIEVGHGGIRNDSQGIYFTVFNNPCERPTVCFDTHPKPLSEDVPGKIKQGEWYHFVAVVGDNFNTGYLNGEEIDYRHYNFSNADASQFFKNALSHDRMWIGKGFWDFGKDVFFDGYIDDVRIYNLPLKAEEVAKLHDLQKSN